MTALKSGTYIKSSNQLNDSIFEDTIILIFKQNTEGFIGFITNKIFEKSMNELVEYSHCKPYPIFEGGPVATEYLFVLHKRPDLIQGGEALMEGYYLGGNMNQVIQAINNNTIQPAALQIFKGYCGWNAGELEAEIEEGSWCVI